MPKNTQIERVNVNPSFNVVRQFQFVLTFNELYIGKKLGVNKKATRTIDKEFIILQMSDLVPGVLNYPKVN